MLHTYRAATSSTSHHKVRLSAISIRRKPRQKHLIKIKLRYLFIFYNKQFHSPKRNMPLRTANRSCKDDMTTSFLQDKYHTFLNGKEFIGLNTTIQQPGPENVDLLNNQPQICLDSLKHTPRESVKIVYNNTKLPYQ